METEELFIRMVEPTDTDKLFFRALFLDPEVMKNFMDHETRYQELTPAQWKEQQIEAADKRLAQLVKRWVEDRDPFSGFVIIDKKTGSFRAHVTAGHTSPPTAGTAEIALMVPKDKWNWRYGTTSLQFILKYLVAVSRIYHQWSGQPLTIDGEPFRKITAIVRQENRYSNRIFEKKMVRHGDLPKWNLTWFVYSTHVQTAKL
jgi:RimJ/RimL family protein N-acetyltransferase